MLVPAVDELELPDDELELDDPLVLPPDDVFFVVVVVVASLAIAEGARRATVRDALGRLCRGRHGLRGGGAVARRVDRGGAASMDRPSVREAFPVLMLRTA